MAKQSSIIGAFALLFLLLSAGPDVAAQEAKKKRNRGGGPSAARILEERFDRFGPQVGDPLPDVAGFDADGKEFRLRRLKGHTTVLIFGCLT